MTSAGSSMGGVAGAGGASTSSFGDDDDEDFDVDAALEEYYASAEHHVEQMDIGVEQGACVGPLLLVSCGSMSGTPRESHCPLRPVSRQTTKTTTICRLRGLSES